MTVKPLKDLLVIKIAPKENERKTTTGLFLPQEKWEKPRNTATVIKLGPDVTLMATEGKTEVVINPYAVIDTDEQDVKLIRERDILCLIG